MDDFVRNKLTEWGLSELIDRFKDHRMDKESLMILSDLDDQHIKELIPEVGDRLKFKKRLKQLKGEQNSNQAAADSPVPSQQEHEEAADSVQALPSTSAQGKRKLDLQGESSKWKSPNKRQRENDRQTYTESILLSDVKNIMGSVLARLHHQDNTKLNAFLRTKIHDLETDKRELIGVFGRTGAGKSSLINAILGEEDLLPTGRVNACTSVMIKVEASINSKYEADIEFITPEEWKDEMWPLTQFHGNRVQEREDDKEDYRDLVEKLSALYGDEWEGKTPEELIEKKKFREIPEFLQSKKKTLTCESAQELSAKLAKYTRHPSNGRESKEVTRCYWPLVKCVTVKVPNNDLLQHVTLVDLPGNGDRNKSRDKMWKGIVGDCSTVWIVTEINRAASEKEPWEILENACSLMGNGGQCQRIHFICTKSDQSADDRADILQQNMTTKEAVRKEFHKQNKIKKHFQDDCLEVFTVSSKEFLEEKCLNPEDTEIPKLKEFLRDLNNCHSETLNYVKGAFGILSLMCGAKSAEAVGKKAEVCRDLQENMRSELNTVKKSMKEDYDKFETHLKEGVQTSKNSWEKALKSILHPRGVSGSAFHKTLKSVVENGGVNKQKKGKQININMKLASYLTNSIDEEFRKTFPNEVKCGPFNGVIDKFSLGTDELLQNYKDVGLQLNFLKTEEEKIQAKLNRTIQERKKKIYNCLTETIEEIMQEGYKKAAEFKGEGSLEKMRSTIIKHVYENINMFEEAKDVMFTLLNSLMEYILKKLQETLEESIELSLKTDDNSIPDVPTELEMVKRYYDQLKDNPDGETTLNLPSVDRNSRGLVSH